MKTGNQLILEELILAIKVANGWGQIITDCDRNIDAGINPGYFKSVKCEALESLTVSLEGVVKSYSKCASKKETVCGQ